MVVYFFVSRIERFWKLSESQNGYFIRFFLNKNHNIRFSYQMWRPLSENHPYLFMKSNEEIGP